MKPILVAYNPYIHVLGGGEKYFLSVLAVLKEHFHVKLVNKYVGIDMLGLIRDRFCVDLSSVEMLPWTSKKEDDLYRMIPANAVFFQFSNYVPLAVDCKRRILHQQIIFPRFNQASAQRYHPGYDERFLNEEVGKQFAQHDYIFFPSNFIRDGMLRRWPINKLAMSVVHPPVDDVFCGSIPPRRNGIISVGRFDPLKGQQAQIDLVQTKLMELPKDFRLTIIGSARNRLMDELKVRAQALPIEVKYGLNQAALKKEYENSAIFWSATGLGSFSPDTAHLAEAFGLAIAESMTTGCVPVAIKGGGVTEIIDSGKNGYLVSSMDEMWEVTKMLLTDNDKMITMSNRAREKAKAYSLGVFHNRILEIFLEN